MCVCVCVCFAIFFFFRFYFVWFSSLLLLIFGQFVCSVLLAFSRFSNLSQFCILFCSHLCQRFTNSSRCVHKREISIQCVCLYISVGQFCFRQMPYDFRNFEFIFGIFCFGTIALSGILTPLKNLHPVRKSGFLRFLCGGSSQHERVHR